VILFEEIHEILASIHVNLYLVSGTSLLYISALYKTPKNPFKTSITEKRYAYRTSLTKERYCLQ